MTGLSAVPSVPRGSSRSSRSDVVVTSPRAGWNPEHQRATKEVAMPKKKFLKYWDSAYEFFDDLIGCIALFAMIPVLMFLSLLFE